MLQEKWVHTQGGKFWRVKNIVKKIPHIYCEVTHHCEFSPTAMGIVVQLGLKLNTKLGIDHYPSTHHPPTHPPQQTFLRVLGLVGG